jgi:hypothetical protein
MPSAAIEGFVKLSDNTAIYRPPDSNGHAGPSANTSNEPSLIVLCSWMSAAPKHVAKYTQNYHRLYPKAEILWIESTLSGVWLGSDLTAAVEYLGSHMGKEQSDIDRNLHPVLLHMFSNGGARNATYLATSLYEKLRSVPFHAVILDSCPGLGDVTAAANAMTFSLPSQWLIRTIGWYLLYAWMWTYVSLVITFGYEGIMPWIRRLLNDTDLFSTSSPRLYLYSHGDVLVAASDVHDHVEGAKQAGYKVREEVFQQA